MCVRIRNLKFNAIALIFNSFGAKSLFGPEYLDIRRTPRFLYIHFFCPLLTSVETRIINAAFMERSILITGANGGLGSTLVSQLVNSPQSLSTYGIYAVRNTSTAHSLSNILTYTSKSHYELLPVDLSSLESVRAAATCLNQRVSSGEIPQIEALVLNAAVQHVEGRVITVDGFESHFAVNYLANFLFVLMMLESLDKERGRVVVISTAMHDSYHWMNHRTFSAGEKEMFANIETIVRGGEDGETDEEKRMAGMRRYGISKCLLVMFA